jgi:3',5'-cyclic AMP phosphodiesterase CpdA
MRQASWIVLLAGLLLAAVAAMQPEPAGRAGAAAAESVVIAHIADTHIGERRSPNALQNLRRVAELVAQRRPDAVLVTGDIAQSREGWEQVRRALGELEMPVHYVPGNHDVTARNLERYRNAFGEDWFRFQVGNITFLALNSQLMGVFTDYSATTPPPLSAEGQAEFEKMLAWLERQPASTPEAPVMALQHVPHFRDPAVVPDPRPYWVTQDPYRQRVLQAKRKLGIRQVFAGHWHRAHVFERDGITHRLAPATSWLPWGSRLGFAMHTISPRGEVETEFVFPEGMTPD